MAELRRSGVTVFDAPTDEAELAAVLVTRDDAGETHHYIRTGPGAQAPDPDVTAMFAQHVEIRNL